MGQMKKKESIGQLFRVKQEEERVRWVAGENTVWIFMTLPYIIMVLVLCGILAVFHLRWELL